MTNNLDARTDIIPFQERGKLGAISLSYDARRRITSTVAVGHAQIDSSKPVSPRNIAEPSVIEDEETMPSAT